ncbi:hypothetical protein ACRAWC_01570 [Leifsonia sp. L25]|uniref:hypothetical protein n=1 Tax=Actinomycetes TaxID=1760 RepID=UPI003D68420B
MRETTAKDQANAAATNELKDGLARATTASEQREIIRELSGILIGIVRVWSSNFYKSFAQTIEADDLNGIAHVAVFTELNALAGNPTKLNNIRDLLAHLHTVAYRECQHASNENGFVDRRDMAYIVKARREFEARGVSYTNHQVAALANSYNNDNGGRQHRRTLTAADVLGIDVRPIEALEDNNPWHPVAAISVENEVLALEHSRRLAAQALNTLTENERGLILSVLVEGRSRVKVCGEFGYTTREVSGVIDALVSRMRSALNGLDLHDLSYAA